MNKVTKGERMKNQHQLMKIKITSRQVLILMRNGYIETSNYKISIDDEVSE